MEWAKGVALRAGAAVGLLAALDFGLARWRHGRELMMTREEVRNEHKESEGDPHHKHQRRAIHRQLAAGGPARGVRSATAVVVNPTHIAVALRYQPEECDAPYLVAKGREADALALRREAERLGVPIVRDVPLARSLVRFDVGMEIPEELYQAENGIVYGAAHHAFRFLLTRYGLPRIKATMAAMKAGAVFPKAFAEAVGLPVEAFSDDFKRYVRLRGFRGGRLRPIHLEPQVLPPPTEPDVP
jgi:type III secretion system FlhB-like substrate exporter